MNSIQLFWEHSPLWLLPVFVFAGLLAWWQYRGNQDFSNRIRLLLSGMRTLLYILLGILLLNPLLRYFKENRLPPVSVILVDNSRSVQMATRPDSLNIFLNQLKEIQKKLEAGGSQVFFEGLSGPVSDSSAIRFREEDTNLEAALKRIRSSFEGQNLAQVILASDGIINQGGDLQDALFPFKINSIGLGNPDPAKDLRISELRHNRTVYLGNQFPVQVEIRSAGLSARQLNIRLREQGKAAETKTITISPSGTGKAEFSLKALNKGIHEFVVELDSFPGEVTYENNRRKFFIEVISEKQKILLLASSPHPDLKAIRSALEPLEQIELSTCIAGLDAFRQDQYSLVILHQLPDKAGSFSAEVSRFLQTQTAGIFLIGTAFTDFNKLRNDAGKWLSVQGNSIQAEEAGNRFDPAFQRFLFDENYRQILNSLPPVKSPGTAFTWKGSSETILNQLIGRAASPTPLLSVQVDAEHRRAIFWGDGIWLWRLNEYARNENTEAVDNLIQKTVLLLLSSAGKKQLLVRPVADEYSESDLPAFQIETFNQLMEPVFDKKVQLSIRGTGTVPMEFSMVTSPGNPQLRTRQLPSGAYHYKATSNIEGKDLVEEGDFVVRAFDLEARQLEASHSLLKGISEKTKGRFYHIADMSKMLENDVIPPPLVEFTDWNENLLGMKWMLIFMLVLLSAEWLLRKMNGTI